jgi:hypothetical protein
MRKGIWLALLLISSLMCQAQDERFVPYRKGKSWGYASADGKIVIPPTYERTYFFSADGLARVKNKGLFGYISSEGKMVIIPRYTSASDFYMGVASVESNKRKYCINMDGEEEECNTEEEEDPFAEEDDTEFYTIEKASNGKGYRLIINSSQDTLPDVFDDIRIIRRYFFPQYNYVALVSKKGLWGAFNEQGVVVAPTEFTQLDVLDVSTYKGKRDNGWGVRKVTGETVIPFQYDSIAKATDVQGDESIQRKELYVVGRHGKYGLLDADGKVVLKTEYDRISVPPPCNCETEFIVIKNGMAGVASAKGEIIIPLKYKSIEPFSGKEYTLIRTQNNEEGYISRAGREYFAD